MLTLPLSDLGLLAAFFAVTFNTLFYIFSKYTATKVNNYKLTLLILGIGILPMLIALIFTGQSATTSLLTMTYALIAGIFFGIGFALCFKSLQTEQVTNTSALEPLQQLTILLFGVLVLSEKLTVTQILAAFMIFVGVLLVSSSKGFKINKFLGPAILANLSWAAYWILLSYGIGGPQSNIFPTLLSRVTAFFVILAYSSITGNLIESKKRRKVKSAILPLLLILTGFVDAGINLSFSFTLAFRVVALGSAIYATTPIFVALIGRAIYKDKLTKSQLLGIIMAVFGAAAIVLSL